MEVAPTREVKVDLGDRSYPIYIGEDLLSLLGEKARSHNLSIQSPILIVTDVNVGPLYLNKTQITLQKYGYTIATHVVSAGESSKCLEELGNIITSALEAKLDRDSTIIALGGGVVGDLAGFAAATYMRGIRFIQIPTTLLAHDSSVGGKVAVNHPLAKNVIGAFHQPAFVLYDTTTLKTLSTREIRSGLAEIIKHGFIHDESFVSWCENNIDKLLSLDTDALSYAIHAGCSIKAWIVSQDEKESGLRAFLNLGHTIGHALESVAGYGELTHGEAISIGMCGAALLSSRLGVASDQVFTYTEGLIKRLGLPTVIPERYATDAIMDALLHDKKFRGGQMVFILPDSIGKVHIHKGIPMEEVRRVVDLLKEGDRSHVR
jgi:3-dehydroquinate synthase